MHRLRRWLTVLVAATALLLAGAVVPGPAAARADAAGAAARYRPMSSTEKSFARSVVGLLNEQRGDHGLPRLRISRALTRAAMAHNRAMARVDEISHRLDGERDLTGRMRAAGWKRRCPAGENIGVNLDTSREGAMQLQAMMYAEVAPNDGHRQNILNRGYTHVGVAVLLDRSHDKLWLTLDFGRRRC